MAIEDVRVSELYIYPIKSCRGLKLSRSEVGARGLLHDRIWMLIDKNGTAITQRNQPKMALIEVVPQESGLLCKTEGMPDLYVELRQDKITEAEVWGTKCLAVEQAEEASAWFGEYLNTTCRLVRMEQKHKRLLDPKYDPEQTHQVGFADGYPFLVISRESLAELNSRLAAPVTMDRFRPNIVIEGLGPYAEDNLKSFRIGNIGFKVVKPCSRCVMISIDQTTAITGTEPMKTLAQYRTVGNKVMYGQNLIHDGQGIISVGDQIEGIN